ncbi:MAG TPA: DUF1553 domain-containing protein, partial [Planctomycetia bacterium]|nr:DUF1553 domain-containing protein [Planctomycetia bacterium]
FLGLTVNCARCHDHKFDPVGMSDYYALYGMFHSTRYPWPGIELEQRQRDLVPLADAKVAEKAAADRQRRYEKIEGDLKKLYGEKSKAKDGKAQAEVQKRIDAAKKEQREVANAPWPFPTAYAVAEAKKIEDVKIQEKGDPAKLGAPVARRFLEVLGGQSLPSGDHTSGRAALAGWIASPDNPLTARVIVNRVWLHRFGRGLVPTPNDFGKQGAPPTHPELLDHLARWFIDHGWSLKKLHRHLLLTRTYRLASTIPVQSAETVDPDNHLLGKFRRRRLDAESIRDSLLAVSGKLDPTPGGAHPFPEAIKWEFTQHKPFRAVYETDKRSVYLMTQRTVRHPYLAVFDGPDAAASTGARTVSTTTLQSLYFLNDPFFHSQAAAAAKRIRAAGKTDRDRIVFAYRLLFARLPADSELSGGEAFLKRDPSTTEADHAAGWESYLRVLLRLAEFIYLD